MNKFLDFAEFTHWLLRWPPFWVELVPIAYQLRSLVVWHRQSFCWNGYSFKKLCASDPVISDSDLNSGQRKKSHLPKKQNNSCWRLYVIQRMIHDSKWTNFSILPSSHTDSQGDLPFELSLFRSHNNWVLWSSEIIKHFVVNSLL